ncbi:MAG: hypothetical protein HQM08_03550 [Candidatus Riflebacteria bacterium]|nr:hypothetical protein [Candidatus Riflebacteria bacterium]
MEGKKEFQKIKSIWILLAFLDLFIPFITLYAKHIDPKELLKEIPSPEVIYPPVVPNLQFEPHPQEIQASQTSPQLATQPLLPEAQLFSKISSSPIQNIALESSTSSNTEKIGIASLPNVPILPASPSINLSAEATISPKMKIDTASSNSEKPNGPQIPNVPFISKNSIESLISETKKIVSFSPNSEKNNTTFQKSATSQQSTQQNSGNEKIIFSEKPTSIATASFASKKNSGSSIAKPTANNERVSAAPLNSALRGEKPATSNATSAPIITKASPVIQRPSPTPEKPPALPNNRDSKPEIKVAQTPRAQPSATNPSNNETNSSKKEENTPKSPDSEKMEDLAKNEKWSELSQLLASSKKLGQSVRGLELSIICAISKSPPPQPMEVKQLADALMGMENQKENHYGHYGEAYFFLNWKVPKPDKALEEIQIAVSGNPIPPGAKSFYWKAIVRAYWLWLVIACALPIAIFDGMRQKLGKKKGVDFSTIPFAKKSSIKSEKIIASKVLPIFEKLKNLFKKRS